jgi:Rps23 Pro-64 3,4-dihydroxylase Tpa1-like proline 4-hydroxylase
MFNKKTIITINNFLKNNYLDNLKNNLSKLKFKKVSQVRDKHFSHVFKYKDPKWPSVNEKWISSFSVAKKSKLKDKLLDDIFYNQIVKTIKKKSKNKIKYFLYPNIYKISSGDFFRCHYDQFAGSVGYTLFISDNWKWDYGGILHFFNKKKVEPCFPDDNKFLIRDERKPLLHFVTQVPKYVKKSHYLILGWAKQSSGKKSKLRGEYLKL